MEDASSVAEKEGAVRIKDFIAEKEKRRSAD